MSLTLEGWRWCSATERNYPSVWYLPRTLSLHTLVRPVCEPSVVLRRYNFVTSTNTVINSNGAIREKTDFFFHPLTTPSIRVNSTFNPRDLHPLSLIPTIFKSQLVFLVLILGVFRKLKNNKNKNRVIVMLCDRKFDDSSTLWII